MPKKAKFSLMSYTVLLAVDPSIVRIDIAWRDKFGPEDTTSALPFGIPEPALQALAEAENRTTWDESDIVSWVLGNKGQAISLIEKQAMP